MLTYNDLIDEFRLTRSGDAWGDVMGWLFRIADSLTFHHEHEVPAEWRFRPSPLGRADDPEEDMIAAVCDEADPAELTKFGQVLNRAADLLKAQGRDY